MTEILSLAFPGFVFLVVYRWFGRSRSRAGWDYLILTGVAGGFAYLTAWSAVRLAAPWQQFDPIRAQIDQFLPGRVDNGTYLLSFLTALVLGWIIPRILLENRSLLSLCKRIGMRHPPGEIDALSQLQADAQTMPMVVSTSLGQVYIGKVVKITTDPDETTKVLVMLALAGGSRIEERRDDRTVRMVRYNYVMDRSVGGDRLTYLDFKDVVSVSQFGLEEFEQTRASGYSEMSDEYFAVLLEGLTDSIEGFAEKAEEYFEKEKARLRRELGETGPPDAL